MTLWLSFDLDLTLQDSRVSSLPHIDLLDVTVFHGLVADEKARDLRGSRHGPGYSHGI